MTEATKINAINQMVVGESVVVVWGSDYYRAVIVRETNAMFVVKTPASYKGTNEFMFRKEPKSRYGSAGEAYGKNNPFNRILPLDSSTLKRIEETNVRLAERAAKAAERQAEEDKRKAAREAYLASPEGLADTAAARDLVGCELVRREHTSSSGRTVDFFLVYKNDRKFEVSVRQNSDWNFKSGDDSKYVIQPVEISTYSMKGSASFITNAMAVIAQAVEIAKVWEVDNGREINVKASRRVDKFIFAGEDFEEPVNDIGAALVGSN
jgi:hypothetical protein